MNKDHTPVLVGEVCNYLEIAKGRKYIDATLGMGGHSEEIAKRGGIVLGLETDQSAIEVAKARLIGLPITIIHANFAGIDRVAHENGFDEVDGILFDLGVSSIQLVSKSRGFSFLNPTASLDMRLDQKNQGITASDLLNSLRVDQLTRVFEVTMTPYEAKKLAFVVERQRNTKKFTRISDFLDLLGERKGKLHQGTKEFLALRIAVNSELDSLMEALPNAFGLLKVGGVLAVISFHSGEDRIVKKVFKDLEGKGLGEVVTKKPVRPGDDEIQKNKRSRSAILRVIKRKRI